MAKKQSSFFGKQLGLKNLIFQFLEESVLKPFSNVRNEDGSINESMLIRVLSNLTIFKSMVDWKKDNKVFQDRDDVLQELLLEDNSYEDIEEICKRKIRIYMKIAEDSFPNLFDVERLPKFGHEDGTITEGYLEDMIK